MTRCFSALPYNLSMCSTPPPCAHSPTRVVVRECALNARWFVGSQLIFFFIYYSFLCTACCFCCVIFIFISLGGARFALNFYIFPNLVGLPQTLSHSVLFASTCVCVYACDWASSRFCMCLCVTPSCMFVCVARSYSYVCVTRLCACAITHACARVLVRRVARRLLATMEKWEIFTVAVVVAMVVVDTCHQSASLDCALLQLVCVLLSAFLPSPSPFAVDICHGTLSRPMNRPANQPPLQQQNVTCHNNSSGSNNNRTNNNNFWKKEICGTNVCMVKEWRVASVCVALQVCMRGRAFQFYLKYWWWSVRRVSSLSDFNVLGTFSSEQKKTKRNF